MELLLSGWSIKVYLKTKKESSVSYRRLNEMFIGIDDTKLYAKERHFKEDVIRSFQELQGNPISVVSISGSMEDLEKLAEVFLGISGQKEKVQVFLTTQNVLDAGSNLEVMIEKIKGISGKRNLDENALEKENVLHCKATKAISELKNIFESTGTEIKGEYIGHLWKEGCKIIAQCEYSNNKRYLKIIMNEPGALTLANFFRYFASKDFSDDQHIHLDKFNGLDPQSNVEIVIGRSS